MLASTHRLEPLTYVAMMIPDITFSCTPHSLHALPPNNSRVTTSPQIGQSYWTQLVSLTSSSRTRALPTSFTILLRSMVESRRQTASSKRPPRSNSHLPLLLIMALLPFLLEEDNKAGQLGEGALLLLPLVMLPLLPLPHPERHLPGGISLHLHPHHPLVSK